MSKIENQSTIFIVDTIMGECESIISEVEDFVNEYDFTIELDDFESIRYIAEELQSTIVVLEVDILTEEQRISTLAEAESLSIHLYQSIKYEVDALTELELFDYDCQDFVNLRHSINTIRSLFV
jgi:hypothetical protein